MKKILQRIKSIVVPVKEKERLFFYYPANLKNLPYKLGLKIRLSARIQQDLDNRDTKTAIDRYNGFLMRFPMEQDIHNKLGELYLSISDQPNAGKHFYFKESPTSEEQDCIKAFENKYGFDDTIILKKFMPKESFKISACDERIKQLIKAKIDGIEQTTSSLPKFLHATRRHLNKKRP